MVVNVCPAAVTRTSPDRVWTVLTTPERFDDWVDAAFVSADPPGPVKPGQQIRLEAREFGRRWPVSIDVVGVDAQRRWVDFRVHLPFGVENHEHVTLTETKEGGTVVRFN
jgi:ligand-binding SRPBCC domain-containing protein